MGIKTLHSYPVLERKVKNNPERVMDYLKVITTTREIDKSISIGIGPLPVNNPKEFRKFVAEFETTLLKEAFETYIEMHQEAPLGPGHPISVSLSMNIFLTYKGKKQLMTIAAFIKVKV